MKLFLSTPPLLNTLTDLYHSSLSAQKYRLNRYFCTTFTIIAAPPLCGHVYFILTANMLYTERIMMSSTALFEFDINFDKITPEKLSTKINEIVGTESSLSSNVDLVSKEELKTRSHTEYPPELTALKEISDNFINEIEEMIDQLSQNRETDDKPIEYTHKTSSKKWELILGYYIDDDDDDDEFHLFEEVTKLLLEISVGDVYYFREPQAQGNDDYKDAIEISINDLKKYTPDMSEFATYVFR